MQPGIDLRLRTMMKAIAEVVLPAIDPSNRMAVEQASVVLGSMELLRQQIDHAHWYEVADLNSLCNLAADLEAIEGFDVASDLSGARIGGSELAARWDVSLAQVREAGSVLRDAISRSVEAAFAQARDDIRLAVHRLVLDHSGGQIGRERAYVAGTKWDGFPESLQSIEASLRGASPLR